MKIKLAYRTARQKTILSNKIIEYYFNNPHANGYKLIEKKFNVDENFIRKTLTKELERRFKNAESCRKHV
jgi:hypothetical protein|tara:strand:- start:24851 stop:25060 length:210 start_codon:yes stop_codon:yes gene_type:complete